MKPNWIWFVAIFAIAGGATFVACSMIDPTAARVRACCVRVAENASAASAEFQQVVASAIVRNGATITELRAPRSNGDDRLRWQNLEVAFTGPEAAVLAAADDLALMRPGALVLTLRAERGTDGQLAMDMRLIQVIRLREANSRQD